MIVHLLVINYDVLILIEATNSAKLRTKIHEMPLMTDKHALEQIQINDFKTEINKEQEDNKTQMEFDK